MPGGVEEAVLRFVTEGVPEVNQTTGQITADLKTLKETARVTSAEAQASVRAAAELRGALTKLASLARAAEGLARSAGVDDLSATGRTIGVVSSGLSGAAQGARLGSSFGPVGTAAGAVVGTGVGVVEYLGELGKKLDAKVDAANEKILKKIAERDRSTIESDLRDAAQARAVDALFHPARGAE